jgi:hypothetical protein
MHVAQGVTRTLVERSLADRPRMYRSSLHSSTNRPARLEESAYITGAEIAIDGGASL